jgi:hypothetical protein
MVRRAIARRIPLIDRLVRDRTMHAAARCRSGSIEE